MAQEYIQEVERDETVIPPLPDAETDDLGSSMVDDKAEESDAAVEDRLEAEDDEFKDEMEAEADEDASAEADSEAA